MELHSKPIKIKMSGFCCIYCHRNYQKKENLEKHKQMCEFFYRSRHNHDEEYENVPTMREMYQLVREFAYKCDKLQKRVDQLENRNALKQKKQILEYLSEQPPAVGFIELVRTFTISQQHLETVFENDLTAGIKSCLKTHFKSKSDITENENQSKYIFPICSFIQKPNTIYVYDSADQISMNTWKIMTNTDLDKVISILSFKFLQAFVEWKKTLVTQNEPTDYFVDEQEQNESFQQVQEQIKQQQQLYMIKINGQRVNGDKRRNDIKQFLYNYFQMAMPNVVELV
jgi:hypothetical protein